MTELIQVPHPTTPEAASHSLTQTFGVLSNVARVSTHPVGWLPHLTSAAPQPTPESLRACLFRMSKKIQVGRPNGSSAGRAESDLSAVAEYQHLMDAIHGPRLVLFE